jgi:hypothetical protein
MAPTIVASAAMSHFVTLVVEDYTLQREAIADLLKDGSGGRRVYDCHFLISVSPRLPIRSRERLSALSLRGRQTALPTLETWPLVSEALGAFPFRANSWEREWFISKSVGGQFVAAVPSFPEAR